MRAGISDPTRPHAAKELDGLQIIDNRPLAVSLPRPDEFSRLIEHRENVCDQVRTRLFRKDLRLT
jgi:hypothetical protein